MSDPLIFYASCQFAGLAPGPMVGMILADFGADVIRIDRAAPKAVPTPDVLARGKRSIAVDPKVRPSLFRFRVVLIVSILACEL